MQRKKQTAKETETKETKKIERKKISVSGILMGTGRRKASVARVWLKKETGPLLVNEKPIDDYFTDKTAKKIYEEPLRVVNRMGQFSGTIKVTGGGVSSQLGAVALGMARALVSSDPSYKPILSKKKPLTRDPKMKERRKKGQAGTDHKMKQSAQPRGRVFSECRG